MKGKTRRYDDNPDVDEVMRYSGAGEAEERRVREEQREEQERRWRAQSARVSELNARVKAGWDASERAERRSNLRFVVGALAVLVAVLVALWASRSPGVPPSGAVDAGADDFEVNPR